MRPYEMEQADGHGSHPSNLLTIQPTARPRSRSTTRWTTPTADAPAALEPRLRSPGHPGPDRPPDRPDRRRGSGAETAGRVDSADPPSRPPSAGQRPPGPVGSRPFGSAPGEGLPGAAREPLARIQAVPGGRGGSG